MSFAKTAKLMQHLLSDPPTEWTWMISSYLPGKQNLSQNLQKLSSSLCLLPQMSLAYHLSGEMGPGLAFCCLPLPHGAPEAVTGLPVHVNAYFGLNDNRRSLKWTGDDQKHDQSAL